MNRLKIYFKLRLCYFGLGFLFMFFNMGYGQTVYKMSNAKIYGCKGGLTDSENNQQAIGKYANNENLIFTIVVKGASSINFKFKGSFCTEAVSDYLKVYKGRDTTGTLIRTYSGIINNPASFSVSDSAVTFYFHSDANIVCDGWELTWEGKVTLVPQPKFTAIANPTCNSTKIRVTLDQKFNCDSVKAANFKLSGTLSTTISSISAINCDSKNETSTFDITFASGLNKSGNYTLDFNSFFKDACDSIWKINAKLNFKITDCPIVVDLRTNRKTICKGACASLTAIITGGNAANYSYNWISGGLTGAPPKTVCPTVNTQYILEVSDGVSVPGKDTVDIIVLDPPVAQNDTTVCQTSGVLNLKALPAGGTWSGTGITNATNGAFNPLVSGGGVFKVFYNTGTCRDSVIVTVRAINAGSPAAACPGSAPFMVAGFSPTGGSWSGLNITNSGLITPPSVAGSFVVTYSWNGCTSNKTINIDNIILAKKIDTICKSVALDTFKGFSPIGGVWTGPGVTNARLGINAPLNAGAGNKIYIYTINGCRDTFKRFINDVDARWDDIACPDAGQKLLPAGLPSGGYWKGKGIFDAVAGIFDADSFRVPGKSTFAQTTLTYFANNGCKDNKIMYLRYTRFYADTIKNCVYDTAYFMRNAYLQNDPWNMLFSGSNAIVGNAVYNQKFSPSLAKRGTFHQIIGDANGCKDTIVIQIYDRPNIQKDTVFCIADNPFKLKNKTGKGSFSGKGITNGVNGIFSPAVAGAGNHVILFNFPGRCTDTVIIKVNALPNPVISGLKNYYCFKDSISNLKVKPFGGILSGNGILDSSFNPKLAGEGFHTITYKVGTGKCTNITTRDIEVGAPLELTLNIEKGKDSICIGTTVALTTTQKTGLNNATLTWRSGQIDVPNIYESPKKTTVYRVVLQDGCSDSVEKFATIFVHPPMYGKILSSDIKCFGNNGFASITMNQAGPFKYLWNTIPPQTTANITAPVSNVYKVNIINETTGCTYDTSANILGYPRIRAFFTTAPAGQCVYSSNALVKIINLSEGGKQGVWDYGDFTKELYDEQSNPSHLYQGDTDSYTITLRISNEGGCSDSFKVKICVLDTISLFIPDAFTPNDDETNDVFKIYSSSLTKLEVNIFNRWGEMVFQSNNPKFSWDGRYKGNLCPTDYYIYTIKYKGKATAWKYKKGVFYILR